MKLAIGTANFYCNYGTTKNYLKSKDAVEKVLLFLKRKKIFIIDTALNYDGNEKFFHNHDLKSFKIITKLKLSKKKNIVKYYLNTLNNNLKKNNLKNYESVLIHNTKSLKQFPKETIKLLKQIKKKKLLKK
ncbi:hypothetical protein ACIJYB_00740 [Candidatus Pelagibacter bacterium nBUS_44]|uniref:hypothetical protein n=1 Tax=Candidatus Pelagibacter bacterium nBUS_44 TaxID=3374195 RepID=UPI003EBC7C1C